MRRSPRTIIHRDRTVTITGLSYDDFQSIITAAVLMTYDELKKKPTGETLAYDERRLKMCKVLKPEHKWVNPYRDIPVSKLRPHEKVSRLSEVRSERHFRLETDRIIEALFKDAKEITE